MRYYKNFYYKNTFTALTKTKQSKNTKVFKTIFFVKILFQLEIIFRALSSILTYCDISIMTLQRTSIITSLKRKKNLYQENSSDSDHNKSAYHSNRQNKFYDT